MARSGAQRKQRPTKPQASGARKPESVRHEFAAAEDAELVTELAERGIVLDVSPVSNVRTGAVGSLAEHPLPRLVAAGVRCSISTDDPAMFDTDLTRDYAAAGSLGVEPRSAYEAGVEGALCDEGTRKRLQEVGEGYDWSRLPRAELV